MRARARAKEKKTDLWCVFRQCQHIRTLIFPFAALVSISVSVSIALSVSFSKTFLFDSRLCLCLCGRGCLRLCLCLCAVIAFRTYRTLRARDRV